MQEQQKETIALLETKARLTNEEYSNTLNQKDELNKALATQVRAFEELQEELNANIAQIKQDESLAKVGLNLEITTLNEQIDFIRGELKV